MNNNQANQNAFRYYANYTPNGALGTAGNTPAAQPTEQAPRGVSLAACCCGVALVASLLALFVACVGRPTQPDIKQPLERATEQAAPAPAPAKHKRAQPLQLDYAASPTPPEAEPVDDAQADEPAAQPHDELCTDARYPGVQFPCSDAQDSRE